MRKDDNASSFRSLLWIFAFSDGLLYSCVLLQTSHSLIVVYDFFNDESEQQGNGRGGETSDTFERILRNDFAAFLEKSLPGTQAAFEILNVKLKTKSLMLSLGPRAVLSIEPKTLTSSPVKKSTEEKVSIFSL